MYYNGINDIWEAKVLWCVSKIPENNIRHLKIKTSLHKTNVKNKKLREISGIVYWVNFLNDSQSN